MAYWTAKEMGILFGGVTDEDLGDEGMRSIFWNELFGYKTEGSGRWVVMGLKKGKKAGSGKGKKKSVGGANVKEGDSDREKDGRGGDEENVQQPKFALQVMEEDPEDPLSSTPLTRYNAMLAILRNTLYM